VFELTVASKHILGNPRMAFFTVLSVALAVAIIVVMMGLMGGFKEEVIRNTLENNPHLVVEPKEDEKEIQLYRTIEQALRQYPAVEAVSARLKGKAAAKHRDKVQGVDILGVNPEDEEGLMRVGEDTVSGDFLDLKFRRNSAFIGSALAEEMNLTSGEEMTLIRQNRSVKVRVAGILKTGTSLDKSLVYLPLQTCQDLMGKGDVVSEVAARLSDFGQAQYIAADFNARTRYVTKSWEDANRDLFKLIETQSWFALVFYVLIFIIAGFGIANTMIMIITRRTKEIGIMMAMGARRLAIMKIFIIESVILAPPSALIGCLVGYLTAQLIMSYQIEVPSEIYMVSRMTVEIKPEHYIYAVLFSIAVNLMAGIYPAWKASRMDPVEAIAKV